MSSITLLTLGTSAAIVSAALALIGLEVERRHARRLVRVALATPQAVETAWVSPPDEQGQRMLFVKAVGQPRARTVAMDWEVDELVRRFSQAGIRIDYERESLAA